jgi:hypothetical protein
LAARGGDLARIAPAIEGRAARTAGGQKATARVVDVHPEDLLELEGRIQCLLHTALVPPGHRLRDRQLDGARDEFNVILQPTLHLAFDFPQPEEPQAEQHSQQRHEHERENGISQIVDSERQFPSEIGHSCSGVPESHARFQFAANPRAGLQRKKSANRSSR